MDGGQGQDHVANGLEPDEQDALGCRHYGDLIGLGRRFMPNRQQLDCELLHEVKIKPISF